MINNENAKLLLENLKQSKPKLNNDLIEKFENDFLTMYDRWGGKFILHGKNPNQNSIMVDNNDYLSIFGHPEILKAQVDCLLNSKQSSIQSGVLVLENHPKTLLEKNLANWVGKEDAMIMQSGYTANVGLLQSIAKQNTPIYVDSNAHASLWEGVHSARAKTVLFKHNDVNYLERQIKNNGSGIVVVDSVYSTTGVICNLLEIIEVCEKYNCMIVVDESHTLGTHGFQGSGLCQMLGVTDRVHFITASLAKTMAGRAGFFTIPKALKYHIMSSSFPFIFSSCLLNHEIAALDKTIEVLKKSDNKRDRLFEITKKVRKSLIDFDYPIIGTEQIIALESGTEEKTDLLRNTMEENNIFGAVFGPPATSKNRAMVRITLNSGLSDDQVNKVIETMLNIKDKVQPYNWASYNRNK